ncbi:MAG: prevent-host-death family protein [Acidimicrobiales bacterium]|nr:MAG: prevent-host-death family protein [Acidimicrobiales bacterium]
MRTVPLGEAKNKLSALVDETKATHDTLYWLSKPGIRESIAETEQEYATGTTIDGEGLRAEFGLPSR